MEKSPLLIALTLYDLYFRGSMQSELYSAVLKPEHTGLSYASSFQTVLGHPDNLPSVLHLRWPRDDFLDKIGWTFLFVMINLVIIRPILKKKVELKKEQKKNEVLCFVQRLN